MAHNYEKILAPFARDDSKSKFVNKEKWSKPEFEMLQNIDWLWTLKMDGTCIVVRWNGDKVSLLGHTDKTQFNERTKSYLEGLFCTSEAETIFEDLYGEQPVDICGEFVSKDMNQNYGHPDGHFYAFDIRNGVTGKYWGRESLGDFVNRFPDIDIVPLMLIGSINDAISWVDIAKKAWNASATEKERNRISFIRVDGTMVDVYNPFGDYDIEGLVGHPEFELYNAKGERIITKVKCKDYE